MQKKHPENDPGAKRLEMQQRTAGIVFKNYNDCTSWLKDGFVSDTNFFLQTSEIGEG
jgi:hypothetical protein